MFAPPKITSSKVSLVPQPLVLQNRNVTSLSTVMSPSTEQHQVYLPAHQPSRRPLATSSQNHKLTKVLVLAYYRSGSTYFSEMFNFNSKAFYMFEPLIFHRLPNNKTLPMANGKTRTVGEMSFLQVIDDIFNCRLQSLPVFYLKHSFLTKSHRFARYLRCIQPFGRMPRHSLTYCLRDLIQMCQTSTIRAIKVIRLGISVNSLSHLYKLNPSLKFIHLVRDPRGSMLSQFDAEKPLNGYNAFKRISGHCDKMEKDIEEIRKIRNSTDIEILSVNYEDIAENPTTSVDAVYSFLGLVAPQVVVNGMSQHSSARRYDYKYGTMRKNSTKTAYAWKTKIKFDMVKTIDSYCSGWYHHLGYLPISSRKELLDENNKHRIPVS